MKYNEEIISYIMNKCIDNKISITENNFDELKILLFDYNLDMLKYKLEDKEIEILTEDLAELHYEMIRDYDIENILENYIGKTKTYNNRIEIKHKINKKIKYIENIVDFPTKEKRIERCIRRNINEFNREE